MRRTSTWIIGALLFTGCQAPPPDGSTQEIVGEASSALEGLDACPATTWVGLLPPGVPCQSVPATGWLASEVFPGAGSALPTYCRYEWIGLPADIPDLGALPKHASSGVDGPEWLDRDCRVTAPLTDSTVTARNAVAQSLFDTFRQAIGAPASINYSGASKVRVAVIDTMPPLPDVGQPSLGRSRHGFAMSSIITALACAGNGASCPVQVRPYLALDIKADGTRDTEQGGYFGYHSRVAQKIYEAVHDWMIEPAATRPPHIILNMSIGWDATYGGSDPADLPAPVQAIWEALVYARCRTALVLSAAGNAGTGASPTTGPLYPAAWEQETFSCLGVPSNAPLVYAVGATDAAAGNPPWARPGARPELVADGYLVPAPYNDGTGPTSEGTYSGCSVSTAAATAAAAATWAKNNAYSSDFVAWKLYDTGVPIPGANASFCACLSPPCNCPATKRLCFSKAIGGAACSPTPIANPTLTPAQLTAVQASEDFVVDETGLLTPFTSPQVDCDGVVLSNSGPAPIADEVCPAEHHPNETIVPYSTTQPGVPVCGVCVLSAPGSPSESILEIGMNEELREPVSPGSLSLIDASGATIARFDLSGLGALPPGSVTRVRLPAIDQPFRYGVIEWPLGDQAATTSDVVRVQ